MWSTLISRDSCLIKIMHLMFITAVNIILIEMKRMNFWWCFNLLSLKAFEPLEISSESSPPYRFPVAPPRAGPARRRRCFPRHRRLCKRGGGRLRRRRRRASSRWGRGSMWGSGVRRREDFCVLTRSESGPAKDQPKLAIAENQKIRELILKNLSAWFERAYP